MDKEKEDVLEAGLPGNIVCSGIILESDSAIESNENPIARRLYVQDGELKYRGPNGTITTIALA